MLYLNSGYIWMASGLLINIRKVTDFSHSKIKANIQSSQFSQQTFDAQTFQSPCLYGLTDLKEVS